MIRFLEKALKLFVMILYIISGTIGATMIFGPLGFIIGIGIGISFWFTRNQDNYWEV